MKLSRFALYAWLTLLVTFIVILWGDVVQVTGSGDGCGAHWPVCNGEVLPVIEGRETLIEFTHRLTSGVVFLMSVVLLVWSRRAFPKGHEVRKGANFSLFFMFTESLVGAALVVFRLVGTDASITRAIVAPIHLVNTLFLIAALTLTAWFSSGGKPFRLKDQGSLSSLLLLGCVSLIIIAIMGAITSLGDAIFPVRHTTEAIGRSMSAGEHFLVRLRIYHPFAAIGLGLFVLVAARYIASTRSSKTTQTISLAIFVIYLLQIAVGFLNVALSAALPTQLIHLLLADALWTLWIILAASALANKAVQPSLNEIVTVRAGGIN
ncbi:MAG: COX15/CtaA family protein [Trueperaceae bacterium]